MRSGDVRTKAKGFRKAAGLRKDYAQTSGSEGGRKRAGGRWLWLFLVVLAIAALSYANSVQNQYVFDDLNLIAASSHITGIENIPRLLLAGKLSSYYRPLRTVSYTLDYTLNKKFWYRFADQQWTDRGLVPFGYHVSNIFYHIVTSLLVYLLIFKLSFSARAAFIGASLFALHPVHTDSVTYLSGRRDILFTLFYLAGFYFFLCYRRGRQQLFIVAAFAMYTLSMGSKEMGVTLPVLFLAYDLVTNFSHQGSRISAGYWKALFLSLKKTIMQSYFLYLIIFLGAVAFSYYKVFIKSPSLQSSYYGDSALTTFLTVGRILVHYIKLFVYPIRLNADYSCNAFPLSASFFEPSTCASAILLLLLVYLALKLLDSHKTVALGIAWFFITLLPVCHIIPHHELLAEHYLYLPSVGFCLVVALAGERFLAAGKNNVLLTSCLLAVLMLFAFRIADRNRDWSDSLTLYEKTVQTAPQCARAHSNLGEAYASRGRIDEAIAACGEALAIKPRYAEGHYNLGFAYFKKGMLDEAIAEYTEAISEEPRYPKALNNLGAAYLEKGEPHKAVFYYMKAVEFKRVRPEVLVGLGAAFSKMGMIDRAIASVKTALVLKPSLAVAHNNLAYFYYLKQDYALAITHCDKAIQEGYAVPEQLIKWLEPYRGAKSAANS